MVKNSSYDVVILGAGLAGLTLSRQLLLETDKRLLLVDRLDEVPGPRQKVGESSVQLAGYYFSKVLDLEEYLLREHFMKYNLRFYWKTAGRDNDGFEDYGQSYIRAFSNVASYQINRNTFEAELLRRNRADERFTFTGGISELEVELAEGGEAPHRVRFTAGGERHQVEAAWVVDTTGRGKHLRRRLEMTRQNPVHHSSVFLWVDGLVNFEKLTAATPRQVRQAPYRRAAGHLPYWLATNHFMGEGLWFWVIPLQGKTSLGLVFDNRVLDFNQVASAEKLLAWVCREFPLFARDLPQRRVVDFWGIKNFSHGCSQTISENRWAMSGEAGRFLDPLYSPGSDFIAVHNTLIADAIATDEADELPAKCRLYEQVMRSFYESYVPGFSESYDALGDQEVFSMKYTWELAVYFAFYVFPFVGELFTERRFLLAFLNKLSHLGPTNQNLQRFLSAFYQWKKAGGQRRGEPLCHDFMSLGPLAKAEKTFYEVGRSVNEAKAVLAGQVDNLLELAHFLLAHGAATVLGRPEALTDRGFVEAIDPADFPFDPAAFERLWKQRGGGGERWGWSFDPTVLEHFRQGEVVVPPAPAAGEAARMAAAAGGER